MKSSIYSLIARGLYSVLFLISRLPVWFLYQLSALAYTLLFYVISYRKTVVIQNLSRSFPNKRYGEIYCIMEKFYRCFTDYFAEIIKAISTPAEVLDKKIIFENLALIDKHITAGRSVIVSLGHCGNWEMLNFMPYKLSHDMYAVYKPQRSEVINKLMLKVRSRFGMKLIPDKSIIRHILTKKDAPSVYLFLADQCPHIKEEKYRFPLFNQETYVFSGMEKLARISRSAVIYLHITQRSRGNYTVTCLPICSAAASVSEGEITRKYVDLLVENIEEEPYGWLWTHKRWKR